MTQNNKSNNNCSNKKSKTSNNISQIDDITPECRGDTPTCNITNNNGWNDKIHANIIILENSAKKYKWMHNKMSDRHMKYDKILYWLLSIFLGISALSDFTTAAYCNATFDIRIGTGIILVGIFILQQKYANASYKYSAKEHKMAASSWGKIIHNIKKELSLDEPERQRARDYYDWISNSYDTLIENSPNIDNNIFKEYNVKYSDDIEKCLIQHNISNCNNTNNTNTTNTANTNNTTTEITQTQTNTNNTDQDDTNNPNNMDKSVSTDINNSILPNVLKTNKLEKMNSKQLINKNNSKQNYKKIINAYETFNPARVRYEMDRYFTDNIK